MTLTSLSASSNVSVHAGPRSLCSSRRVPVLSKVPVLSLVDSPPGRTVSEREHLTNSIMRDSRALVTHRLNFILPGYLPFDQIGPTFVQYDASP